MFDFIIPIGCAIHSMIYLYCVNTKKIYVYSITGTENVERWRDENRRNEKNEMNESEREGKGKEKEREERERE